MSIASPFSNWKTRVANLKRDTYALYLACRDPRVPWFAKAVAGLVVAYALSPIDLIPDFIPVLGYIDDLLLVPLGVAVAVWLIRPAVLAEHRRTADVAFAQDCPRSLVGAAIVVVIWLIAALWLGSLGWRLLLPPYGHAPE